MINGVIAMGHEDHEECVVCSTHQRAPAAEVGCTDSEQALRSESEAIVVGDERLDRRLGGLSEELSNYSVLADELEALMQSESEARVVGDERLDRHLSELSKELSKELSDQVMREAYEERCDCCAKDSYAVIHGIIAMGHDDHKEYIVRSTHQRTLAAEGSCKDLKQALRSESEAVVGSDERLDRRLGELSKELSNCSVLADELEDLMQNESEGRVVGDERLDRHLGELSKELGNRSVLVNELEDRRLCNAQGHECEALSSTDVRAEKATAKSVPGRHESALTPNADHVSLMGEMVPRYAAPHPRAAQHWLRKSASEAPRHLRRGHAPKHAKDSRSTSRLLVGEKVQ